MRLETIARILAEHFVPYRVKGARIIADSMIGGTELFEETEDVTDWSAEKLYGWLGYSGVGIW